MLPSFDIPPVGPKQGKLWGATQLVFAYNGVEAHAIAVRKGGYCSRHYHRSKWNRFLAIEGRLIVRLFLDEDTVDETIVMAGQITDVPPMVEHEFEAMDDVTALEIYWSPLDPNDIVRDDKQRGGMLNADS